MVWAEQVLVEWGAKWTKEDRTLREGQTEKG